MEANFFGLTLCRHWIISHHTRPAIIEALPTASAENNNKRNCKVTHRLIPHKNNNLQKRLGTKGQWSVISTLYVLKNLKLKKNFNSRHLEISPSLSLRRSLSVDESASGGVLLRRKTLMIRGGWCLCLCGLGECPCTGLSLFLNFSLSLSLLKFVLVLWFCLCFLLYIGLCHVQPVRARRVSR